MGFSPLPSGTGMAIGFTAGLITGVLLGPIILLSAPLIILANPAPP